MSAQADAGRTSGARAFLVWNRAMAATWLCGHLMLTASAEAVATPAVVQQPRSFGHFIGDVLTQRILLDDGGRPLELAAIPAADRVGAWFERRKPRTEIDAAGRRWLAIDYQIINAPSAPTVASLPALTLAMRSGAALNVGSWPLGVAPLIPGKGEPQAIRPDRSAAELATAPIRRQLTAWLAGLALTLTAWLAWLLWRNSRDSSQRPFARALRELKHLGSNRADGNAEAWLSMHRALNTAVGGVVHAESLQHLFEHAPELKPLRTELEMFYRQSSERFFARSPSNTPFPLMQLCRALRRIERKTES